MRKKILSPEALAALTSGKKLVPLNLDGEGARATAGEGIGEGIGEGTGEGTGEEASGEGTGEELDVSALQEQIDTLAGENSTLRGQLEALTAENDGLKAAALATDAKVKAASEEVSDYKSIVTGHIANMRIALSLAAVDMVNWTSEAILREYDTVVKAFEKALPEGSQVPEPQPKKTAPSAVATSAQAAGFRGLGFN